MRASTPPALVLAWPAALSGAGPPGGGRNTQAPYLGSGNRADTAAAPGGGPPLP